MGVSNLNHLPYLANLSVGRMCSMQIGVPFSECILQMVVTCTELTRCCCKQARLQMQANYCSSLTNCMACIALPTQAELTTCGPVLSLLKFQRACCFHTIHQQTL